MNVPYFDVNRIPLHPSDGQFIASVVREERRVCGAIDERLDVLAREFSKLHAEARAIAIELEQCQGILAYWRGRRRLKAVARRMSDNMDMRHELTIARWKRTYGA